MSNNKKPQDMQLSKQILRFPNLLMGITAALVLSSCGSYENSSYNDGIYTAGRSNEETESYTENNDEPSYYENYFSKQGEEIEQAQQANTSTEQVFTDVDSYSSTPQPNNSNDVYYSENENYVGGNAGWGSNPTSVNINYYDNGFFGNPYVGGPWGWNTWGWGGYYRPWGGFYGGYGPSWNMGWGWNGFNHWGWGYGYYNNFYAPYYYRNYHNPYYRVAYQNSSRNYRSSYSQNNSGRSNYQTRRNSNVNASSNRSNYNSARNSRVRNSSNINARSNVRGYNRNTSVRRNSNATRKNNTFYNNSRRSNNSTYSPRSSNGNRSTTTRSSRSSSSSTRSSGTSTRSSGRSSGGSTRSSGGRRR